MASFKSAVLALVRDGETMTMREAAVLMQTVATALRQRPGTTVRALALDLNIPKPSVTRAVDGLAGLLERVPDPDDKRSVLVVATAAGRKFADRLLAA